MSHSESTEFDQTDEHLRFQRSHHDAKLISHGLPTIYRLNTERKSFNGTEKKVQQCTYGAKKSSNLNKVILIVGETGVGKTTLINTMVNHLLGVRFENGVWYEITDEIEQEDQTRSVTSTITVYEVSTEDNPMSLTIIDTPGYAHTEGFEKDGEIAENLAKLFSDEFGIHYIDAVCFVMKSSQNRLSGKEGYIFHSVLSLFGRDIEENIVFLFTHSDDMPPTNAIKAILKAEIPCKKNNKNQPVFFTFNNRQKEERIEGYEHKFRDAWESGERSIRAFFETLKENNRKSVQMTLDVLKERMQLEACVSNLTERITEKELKTVELTDVQKALAENREKIKNCENFVFTVRKLVFEKVPIENASRWDKKATCCSVCKENCHLRNCWWVEKLSWCEVMKDNYCTVCTGKCHYTKHIKEEKKYIQKQVDTEMTFNELKKEYEDVKDKSSDLFDQNIYKNTKREHESSIKEVDDKTDIEKKLSRELEKIEKEKNHLVHDAYTTIMNLSKIALKADSIYTLQYVDFLIPRLKEEGNEQWLKNLEDLKKAADEEKNKGAMRQLVEIGGKTLSKFVNFISRKKE